MSKRRFWTAEEESTLRAIYPDQPTRNVADVLGRDMASVYYKAEKLGLRKSAAYLAGVHSGRIQAGRQSDTQFQKGHRTWNKGMKGIRLSPATEFKPGHLSGTAADLLKPLGHRRLTKEGYLQEKTRMDGPPHRRWKMVHVLVWEAQHGPVPPGHIITFMNGDKSDMRLENLACMHRRENMARNTRHNMPKELNQIIHLRAQLTRQINKRSPK